MDPSLMASFSIVAVLFYLGLTALLVFSWIYLLAKVSEISRNTKGIFAQQESQSRSLASLAESVAMLVRNSTAQKPEPPAPGVV